MSDRYLHTKERKMDEKKALEEEAKLLEQTDNGPHPEDGEQPVTEQGVNP